MRTKTHAVLVIAALAAATLSACGSDDDDDATTAGATTTTAEATATTAPQPPQPDEPAAAPGPGQEPPPEPAPQELTTFSTPSGNIGCVMNPEYVRCDIRRRDWEPPRRPSDCELDFGSGIELADEKRAHLVCAGDTTLGPPDVLEYGASSRVGPYECVSAAAGITCQADSGHGFFLSKQAYELY